jgi:hypothetical protein
VREEGARSREERGEHMWEGGVREEEGNAEHFREE